MAATALMGTLLASILVTSGKLTSQDARAQRRIEAVRLADELMLKWWPDRWSLAAPSEGEIEGHAGWKWKLSAHDDEAADKLGAKIIRLEVYAPDQDFYQKTPAAQLEFLLNKR